MYYVFVSVCVIKYLFHINAIDSKIRQQMPNVLKKKITGIKDCAKNQIYVT